MGGLVVFKGKLASLYELPVPISFVKYYIYVCKFRGKKLYYLLGTQLISRVIEKLNIILPKRGENFQIISKNGGSIFIFFFLFCNSISWGVQCVFPLLLDCLFIVYRSDSVTLNMISCDNCKI